MAAVAVIRPMSRVSMAILKPSPADAQKSFLRELNVVERELAGRGAAAAHLLLELADGQARYPFVTGTRRCPSKPSSGSVSEIM